MGMRALGVCTFDDPEALTESVSSQSTEGEIWFTPDMGYPRVLFFNYTSTVPGLLELKVKIGEGSDAGFATTIVESPGVATVHASNFSGLRKHDSFPLTFTIEKGIRKGKVQITNVVLFVHRNLY